MKNLEKSIYNIIYNCPTFDIKLENYNLEMHNDSSLSFNQSIFVFIYNIKNKYWFRYDYNFDQLERFLKKKNLFEEFKAKIEEELLRRI